MYRWLAMDPLFTAIARQMLALRKQQWPPDPTCGKVLDRFSHDVAMEWNQVELGFDSRLSENDGKHWLRDSSPVAGSSTTNLGHDIYILTSTTKLTLGKIHRSCCGCGICATKVLLCLTGTCIRNRTINLPVSYQRAYFWKDRAARALNTADDLCF